MNGLKCMEEDFIVNAMFTGKPVQNESDVTDDGVLVIIWAAAF